MISRILAALVAVLTACSSRGEAPALPPELARAFSAEGFAPLPHAEPGDWLAEHPEPGQSFEQFVAYGPNRPTPGRDTIYVVALGEVGDQLPALIDYAGRFFGLPVRELPALAIAELRVTERQHAGRRQLRSTDLLDALRDRLPADAYALIGFTAIDLYPEDSWNFVFGQASLSDRVGVYSAARYGDDDALALDRSLKVLAHEVGHMFGMAHCTAHSCVMNGSNNLGESDRQPHHLCPVCLRKLHWSVGFDPAARYRALEAFYRGAAMPREAAFVAARRGAIEGD